MANAGYPLYGDTKYNPRFKFKRGVETALFASRLKLKYKGEDIDAYTIPTGQAFELFDEQKIKFT